MERKVAEKCFKNTLAFLKVYVKVNSMMRQKRTLNYTSISCTLSPTSQQSTRCVKSCLWSPVLQRLVFQMVMPFHFTSKELTIKQLCDKRQMNSIQNYLNQRRWDGG
ncbi:hypothetical protein SK128_012203, partial [Halocaridina rubra]